MTRSLEHIASIAEDAARRAGALFFAKDGISGLQVHSKRFAMDVVTEVDRAAERAIVAHIAAHFPEDAVIGEEGANVAGESGVRWWIDPVDGTVNFVHGWRVSAVSIGVEIDEQLVVGVVHNPFDGETFTGIRGGGAFFNGARIAVRTESPPWDRAIVGVDGGLDAATRSARGALLQGAVREAGDVRTIGSAALALCYAAIGRLDAHVNIGIQKWDFAAGAVIAREAGQQVEGLDEGTQPQDAYVLTTHSALMPALRALAQGSRSGRGAL